MVIAHVGEAAGTPLWLDWNLDPTILIGLAVFVGAYCYALGPLRRRRASAGRLDAAEAERVNPWQVTAFVAGTAVFALALISPLDALSDEYLFSAHMVQHMLIAVVAPPLWILGVPGWMLAPLFQRRSVARVARLLTHPAVAFTLFNGDLWLWHWPALYDATLSSDLVHTFEHLTFVATAVLFWWVVLSPLREVPPVGKGTAVLYLFAACQPMVALGALLTFASTPFYAPYVTAPRIWGSTPLGDQQLGGLIMWLPTNIPYLIFLSAFFFQWVGIQDRREREEAGEFDEPWQPLPPAEYVGAPDAAVTPETRAG
ncbi:MAG TPA: cytochrome c oxidase assembly protein [Ktedonobacterales bacterium]